MFTLEQRLQQSESASRIWHAVFAAYCNHFDKWRALDNYLWDKPLPPAIRELVHEEAEKEFQAWLETSALQTAVNKIGYTIDARPYIYNGENGFTKVFEGRLPNGELASTDEETAMKMLAAYYAAKAFEPPAIEEAPF